MRTIEREDSTREKIAELTVYDVQSLTQSDDEPVTLVEAQPTVAEPESQGTAKKKSK